MDLCKHIIYVLFVSCFSSLAEGAECRVNGSLNPVDTYIYEIRTTVRGTNDGKQIILDGYTLECRYFGDRNTPPSYTDYWETTSPGVFLVGKLISYGGGLSVNGFSYPIPVTSGVRIATMPWAGSGPWVRMNLYPYVNLGSNPTNPVNINAGEQIAEIRIAQTNNNSSDRNVFYYRLIANNNFSIQPSTCTINDNRPIEIDFGSVESKSIGENALTTTQRKNFRITYECPTPGISQPITVTLTGSAANFDNTVLKMSDTNLGIALIRKNAVVPLNIPFNSEITDSMGGDDVTFSLIKRAGTMPAAGLSTGSGVLILGIP